MEERWDFLEVEVKVKPDRRYSRLVELAQQAAPEGGRMVRKPHTAFFDLYFDSPSFTLANNSAYLRARFDKTAFRRKGKYKLFFKENGPPPEGARYLSRREVRTDVKRDEILPLGNGRLPGVAADLAYEVVRQAGETPSLVPVCVLSSFRRYFTMQVPFPDLPDFLNLGIEQTTAFAARDLDVELLLRSGFIDARDSARSYDFELAEAELTVENVEEADATFQRLVSALATEFVITTGSKYIDCLDKLGLRAAEPVAP